MTRTTVLLRHLRCDDHARLLRRASYFPDSAGHAHDFQQHPAWADRDHVRDRLPVHAARATRVPLPHFRR